MARDDSLRAKVAEQLTTRSAAGGPLHRDAAECTERHYATDVSRLVLHKRIVDRYLARGNPRRDGRSAIITAGAPGSGKSSMLRAVVADLGDYLGDVATLTVDGVVDRGNWAVRVVRRVHGGRPDVARPRELVHYS